MTLRMKPVSFVLTLLLAAGTLATQAWADSIGYVNIDKVIGGYEHAQSLMADMKVREADLRKMQADFVKQIEENRKANAKSPVTADSLEKTLGERLQAKVNEYRDWTKAQQTEVDKTVNVVIAQVAKRRAIDVVVAEQAVLIGGTDLTPEVITTLNKPAAPTK